MPRMFDVAGTYITGWRKNRGAERIACNEADHQALVRHPSKCGLYAAGQVTHFSVYCRNA